MSTPILPRGYLTSICHPKNPYDTLKVVTKMGKPIDAPILLISVINFSGP